MSNSQVNQVILVGHCGFDSGGIRNAVSKAASEVNIDVDLDSANSDNELEGKTGETCLLLINRILDGSFNDNSGINLIKQIKTDHPDTRMMLVSNYADAQADAEVAGALPGFGKSDLHEPETLTRIGEAIAGSPWGSDKFND